MPQIETHGTFVVICRHVQNIEKFIAQYTRPQLRSSKVMCPLVSAVIQRWPEDGHGLGGGHDSGQCKKLHFRGQLHSVNPNSGTG